MIKRLFALLAISMLLFAGCGDDSGSDEADTDDTAEAPDEESTTSTTEEEEEEGMALDEWVEAADEICEEADDATDELGEPQSIDEVVELLPEALPIIEEQVEALEDLGPPDEDADKVEEAIDLLNGQIELLEEALDRIEDGEDPEEVFADIDSEGQDMEDELDEIAEDLGLEVCGGESGSEDDTTTTTDGGSTGEPFTYGDDPELDALWDECEAGSADACDSLWLESPVDSEYEEFGYSCGGKVPEGEAMSCSEVLGESGEEPTGGEPNTYGDDPELDALWDECDGGSADACDQLFLDSPSGSEYEDFGWSCGGRVPEDEIEVCSEIM
jgi:hypothetical protein